MLVFSVFAILMKRGGYPPLAMVMGIMLGGMVDEQLCRANIMYQGDWSVFFTRPISLILVIMIVFIIGFPWLKQKRANKKRGE
jgi:putative tricarboxylic transport membrane protein